MARWQVVLGVLVAGWLATPAMATVQSQSSYNYFAVKGKTAREIYANLMARGPRAGGADAMATTNVGLSQHADLSAGSLCRLKGFSVKLVFKINLPRHANLGSLSPKVRANWLRFAATLKSHEEHHRAIWTRCAGELSSQVTAIKPGPCPGFKARYAAISKDVLAQCKARNSAFDASEKLRFMATPFIRDVATDN